MTHALDLVAERTRLRAKRLSRFMELLWSDQATSPDQGLTITPGEVAHRLLSPDERREMRVRFEAGDRRDAEAIERADDALAADPVWRRLIAAFALSPIEADLLCAAVTLSVQPGLGRVFAYLQDDVNALLPRPSLVAELFGTQGDGVPLDMAALRRWRLAEPDRDPSLPGDCGWRAAPALAQTLFEGRWRDPEIAAGAAVLQPRGWRAELGLLYPEIGERAAARLLAPGTADLVGADGSGRRTLAAQLAERHGQTMLLVDTPRLLSGAGDGADKLAAALRMARFEDALACFAGAAAAGAELWRQVLPAGQPVVRCFEPGEAEQQHAAGLPLPVLSLPARLALWRTLSREPAPPAIAANAVTPADVARLANGFGIIASDASAPELLTRLPMPYQWSDLILPADTESALRDFARQVRLRGPVLDEWGFDRLTHLGSGLIALFAGPSGVGKTMAAQVLARELGLELFRIDLAGVVDKYIGETEKRLRAAFAFAERPGVLLFFDEADALFGTRTQAKDSHDRYANLEINYLLQRIETFEGVALLATNRKSELDAAFRRRIRVIIDFLHPGPEERLTLWQLALPPTTPAGEPLTEGVDHGLLAERLALTGADIKAAALGAAFLARADDSTIRMRHVLAATQREMAKHGQTLRLPLGEVKSA